MKKTLLLAGVACIFAANANAETTPYVGLDFNYSTLDYAYDLENDIEDDYQSLTVVAGAKLSKNFGVEAFYQRSRKETNTKGAEKFTTGFQAYGLDLLGYLPLGCEGKVDLIGGVGLGEYELKSREVGEGSDKEESLGYRLNLGLQYNFDENWSVRGMYHHVYTQHSAIDAIDEFSVGVRYHF